jgi:hypothetical protein
MRIQRKARSAAELRPRSPGAATLGAIRRDATQLDAVASYWAHLGVLFGVRPAQEAVDVELLICDTARVAPADERLFICAVSWVAQYHAFVNGRRLSALAASLDPDASAVLGALLSVASEAAGGAPELEAARARCRPLATPQPLFAAVRSMRVLNDRVRRDALPIFSAWGLWHNDATIKPAAIRPVTWLIQRVPELRVRSLLGPSVEADLMARVLAGVVTVREVARMTLTSYAAVHSAADRLVWRGLVVRERVAQSQVLRPTNFAVDVLQCGHPTRGRGARGRARAPIRRSAARAVPS